MSYKTPPTTTAIIRESPGLSYRPDMPIGPSRAQPATLAGQMRHAERALTVAVHRGLIRPMAPYLLLMNDWAERHPGPAWLDRMPSLTQMALAALVIKGVVIVVLLLANGYRLP